MRLLFLFVSYLLLELSKINCLAPAFTPFRSYPQQWEETTNYTYKYLNSNYTIKEKGSDLLALSSLLLSMGYDMHPPKLNAYIIDKNGTFQNGKGIITYFPGNILIWEGFKQFGLQYMGEYEHHLEFLQTQQYTTRNLNYAMIVVVESSFKINGFQKNQFQYLAVDYIWFYRQRVVVQNYNDPSKTHYHFYEIIKYIVFRNTQNGTDVTRCQNFIVLEGDKSQCLETIDNQDRFCVRYMKNSQDQIVCIQCRQSYYLNSENQCIAVLRINAIVVNNFIMERRNVDNVLRVIIQPKKNVDQQIQAANSLFDYQMRYQNVKVVTMATVILDRMVIRHQCVFLVEIIALDVLLLAIVRYVTPLIPQLIMVVNLIPRLILPKDVLNLCMANVMYVKNHIKISSDNVLTALISLKLIKLVRIHIFQDVNKLSWTIAQAANRDINIFIMFAQLTHIKNVLSRRMGFIQDAYSVRKDIIQTQLVYVYLVKMVIRIFGNPTVV